MSSLSIPILLLSVLAPTVGHADATFELNAKDRQYNLAPHLAYYEDLTNRMTAEQVAKPDILKTFRPDGRATLNRGFATHTLWATVLLNNGSDDTLWYVVLGYALLDDVELFAKTGDGPIQKLSRAGDTLNFEARPIHVASIVLPVNVPKGAPVRIFLRLKTAGTFYSPISIHTSTDLVESVASNQVRNGLYFGALSILALYNLLLFFYFRRPTYLVFAGLTVALIIWYMSEKGWVLQYLVPNSPDLGARLLVLSLYSIASLGLLLNWTFLRDALTHKELKYIKTVTVGAFVLLFVSQLVPYGQGVRFGLFMVAAYIGTSFYLSLRCWLRGYAPARIFFFALLFPIAAGGATIIRNIGVLPVSDLTVYGPMLSVGFFIFMLSIALTEQINITQRTRDALSKSFAKFVPRRLVTQLLESREVIDLGGEEKNVTVLFSDIKGYSTISEKMEPSEVVKILTEYFDAMQTCVETHGGAVLEYIGDGILAVFGAPAAMPEHPDAAVRCALAMQDEITRLNKDWENRGLSKLWQEHGIRQFFVRIGLHTGNVIAGNMGSRRMMKYGIVGDTVNVAARLEQLNNSVGTLVLLSEEVHEALSPDLRDKTTDQGLYGLKGRNQKQRVFSVGPLMPEDAVDSVDFSVSSSDFGT